MDKLYLETKTEKVPIDEDTKGKDDFKVDSNQNFLNVTDKNMIQMSGSHLI